MTKYFDYIAYCKTFVITLPEYKTKSKQDFFPFSSSLMFLHQSNTCKGSQSLRSVLKQDEMMITMD